MTTRGARARTRRPRCRRVATAATITAALTSGCRTAPAPSAAPPDLRLDVAADVTAVPVGGTVTLELGGAGAADPAEIRWIASGGELTASAGGRTARVRFDEPGVYRVTATLFHADRIVDTRTVAITVE